MKKDSLHNTSFTILLVCIVITGFVLRCWNINQSFWWDELWSTMAYVKARSLWQVVSSLGYYFNNHIFYSLLARASVKIMGESELATRLPAVIMGLLGIIVVFQFGKRFLGTPSGIITSFLLALSAFHIDHSSEARGYSGLALFSILSSFYFLKGLKANEHKSWVLFVLFTVLGFYSHVFMCAVSLSQLFSFLLFIVWRKWCSWKTGITVEAFRNFLLSLLFAGITTLLIYSPILPFFFTNMGKVRLVDVTRIPFILNLLNSFFPGVKSFFGCAVYIPLFFFGMYSTLRKDAALFLYLFVLLVLPLSLYIMINPMFVFERYFVFVLPFVLLTLSQGVIGLAVQFKGIYRSAFVLSALFVIVYLQFPAIDTVVSQDRQNYREAVRYIVNESGDSKEDLVFSIGYAGEHFRYYAPGSIIHTPVTLKELSEIIRGKKRIWCLITAWLPDLCPPYEDKDLYSERSGQVEIYNYVKKHFTMRKYFPSKHPVEIYFWEG